jgi:hypothetical protein
MDIFQNISKPKILYAFNVSFQRARNSLVTVHTSASYDKGNRFLQSVGNDLSNYTASHIRRQQSSPSFNHLVWYDHPLCKGVMSCRGANPALASRDLPYHLGSRPRRHSRCPLIGPARRDETL